jgi:hypothetical protein
MVQEHSERGAGTMKCNTQPSTPLNFQGPPMGRDRLENSKLSLTIFVLTRQIYTAFMGLLYLHWYIKKAKHKHSGHFNHDIYIYITAFTKLLPQL